MLEFFIAVATLSVVLGGSAVMWFIYVRRDDPDRRK